MGEVSRQLFLDKITAWDDKENLPWLIGVPAAVGLALTGRRLAIKRGLRKAEQAVEAARVPYKIKADPLKGAYVRHKFEDAARTYEADQVVSKYRRAAEDARQEVKKLYPRLDGYVDLRRAPDWAAVASKATEEELAHLHKLDSALLDWDLVSRGDVPIHFIEDLNRQIWLHNGYVKTLRKHGLITDTGSRIRSYYNTEREFEAAKEGYLKYKKEKAIAQRSLKGAEEVLANLRKKDNAYLNRLGELGLLSATGLGAYGIYKRNKPWYEKLKDKVTG